MADIEPAVLLSFRNNLRSCVKCPLHKVGRGPVPWSGPLNPQYAVLGEAPGSEEDKYKEPFVGSAGILLKYALKDAGIDPRNVAFINSVSCYPKRTPNDSEIAACRGWMTGQVAFVQPQILISVGVVALQSIRGDKWPKLANLHGKPLWWDSPPAPLKKLVVFPTYHPAAALRSAKYKRLIQDDLRSLVQWVKDGMVFNSDDCYICGEEMHRVDEWGIPFCSRHCARQGILWEESA